MADAESGASAHVPDNNCFLISDNCQMSNFKVLIMSEWEIPASTSLLLVLHFYGDFLTHEEQTLRSRGSD